MAGRLVRAVAIERFGYGVIARCGGRFVEQVVLGKSGGFQFGVGLVEPEPLHALAAAPVRAGARNGARLSSGRVIDGRPDRRFPGSPRMRKTDIFEHVAG